MSGQLLPLGSFLVLHVDLAYKNIVYLVHKRMCHKQDAFR